MNYDSQRTNVVSYWSDNLKYCINFIRFLVDVASYWLNNLKHWVNSIRYFPNSSRYLVNVASYWSDNLKHWVNSFRYLPNSSRYWWMSQVIGQVTWSIGWKSGGICCVSQVIPPITCDIGEMSQADGRITCVFCQVVAHSDQRMSYIWWIQTVIFGWSSR